MPIPSEWSLAGKTAIITSDRRGWTPYLAAALAEAGADVAIAGSPTSDMPDAAAAVRAAGRRAIELETDLTGADDVAAMVDSARDEFGRIDILVNNARVEFAKPFVDVTDEEWDAVIAFNLRSMFLCCRAVGRLMLAQGGGRIVNVGTGLSERGLWNSAAACASQGAIKQLTAALGLEWARSGVRVNGIGAGWLTTEPREGAEPELLERYIPSRRKGHPTDLAGLLVYLASDASDFMTGQTVYIDGGAMAHA